MNTAPSLLRFVLPAAMLVGLIVVFVPLPTWMMDILLALNLGASILILVSCISITRPTDFSIFPALLLITSIARIALNIATTRLILTNGASDGGLSAGGIVEAFGNYVVGNQILVGIILFAILVIVQFIVITKGATRIGEVSARFMLDSLPGRQMGIDAEVTAGTMPAEEARRRRQELIQQADFFGAMDGASKFLRGDAIAGVAIIFVNLLGGLYAGVIQNGMPITRAVDVYTRLTVGDGLVSQLPAFLVSVGAGILLARCSEGRNFAVDFVQQLFLRRESLLVAATSLLLLAFTKLPTLPFLAIALMGLAIARTLPSREPSSPPESEPRNVSVKTQQAVTPAEEKTLSFDPLELELGVRLLPLADRRQGGALLEQIAGLRQSLVADLGIVLPRLRVRDNLRLGEFEFRLKLLGNEVRRGRIIPSRVLAIGNSTAQYTDGIPGTPLHADSGCVWLDPEAITRNPSKGLRYLSPPEALLEYIRGAVHRHADELMTRDAVQHLLEEARKIIPAVVAELVPQTMRLGTVQQVLKQLLRDRVPIKNLPIILEALCDLGPNCSDPTELTNRVRERLARTISTTFRDRDGRIRIVRLTDELETTLQEARAAHQDPQVAAEIRSLVGNLCREIERQTAFLKSAGLPRIVVVRQSLRATLQQWVTGVLPDLIVLGDQEITSDTHLEAVVTVGSMAMAA
jgi:flagellar biosynthesis protein FlhA